MSIYDVMSDVVKAVRKLEVMSGNSAVLRAWLTTNKLNKPKLDSILASGYDSAASIEAIVNNKPKLPPQPIVKTKRLNRKGR
mgnify:FL=1